MSKTEIKDKSLKDLYDSFYVDFEREVDIITYTSLHKTLCDILNQKYKQNELQEEFLKTQTKLNEMKNREYLSDVALGISIMSLFVSLFAGIAQASITLICIFMIVIAIASGKIAYKHHGQLRRQIVYYEFKLQCINEISNPLSSSTNNFNTEDVGEQSSEHKAHTLRKQ